MCRLDEHWADHEVVSIAVSGGDEQVLATDQDFFDYHYGRTFGSPLVAPDGQAVLEALIRARPHVLLLHPECLL